MIDVVCDLDGVVYLGDHVIDGVPEAMQRLRDAGGRLTFVTNNASKTPAQVASKIEGLTGQPCDVSEVCTSPQAAARMLRPSDSPVFVVGEEGITIVLEAEGHHTTTDADLANSVVAGLTRRFTYEWLADAAGAVRRGARFLATNVDPTYPTATGILPGAGSIVTAIAVASGVEPEIAGKPLTPMRDLVKTRVRGPAWVIGDRVDTDIAMAADEPDWASILVLSGVTSAEVRGTGADHVVGDFPAAVDLVLDTARQR